ncbi:FGGY-family carbohydrate kinase [Mannheimia sp. AT1]|uniref:FGGY-family carbohydrate kinase n=1 Tax=Mannheimia cairinae TaxID=3025936 RepID=A0ABT5MQ79_9PAST|nr:FGGY-family carbohydrate kinase [Mannheimia cairinae]MDD0824210.1 FGGY-family carbohydrate kinase [Mannheimia cairinae]MDD0826667.1 FGGY-family carbohydrate kinase [Mannheimia cairinae]
MSDTQKAIIEGNTSLGIEFGSTRIKAVLIDSKGNILAVGGFNWENHFSEGVWTYPLTEVWQGVQAAFKDLTENVQQQYGQSLQKIAHIGVSAMMHGYLAFNKQNELLVPFRTWRNNFTAQASHELTQLFNYNIPQRWSIAHLYQAILNQEEHLPEVDFITTLAGYVHWQLTGEKVLGVGDASGMFPIDLASQTYNASMLSQFDEFIENKGFEWSIEQILPKVLVAGENAGTLTEQGALLLDPTGNLQAGALLCPPEGDAGTGMVATNSISEKTGNISAGTSAFAMIVLQKELSKVYEELDMVTTPTGKLVAMAHSNNCSSDINAWVGLFKEMLSTLNLPCDTDTLYQTLFLKALEGDADCGNLLSYGFYSGEHIVGLSEGCPTFMHPANANFNLANFMRVHLYTAFAAMKIGMDILMQQEKVEITQILGHGGIFKTENVAQKFLASALNVPIATMQTASEGGAWGIALLANYLNEYKKGISLDDYLNHQIFNSTSVSVSEPDAEISAGYEAFMQRYKKGIKVVQEAVLAFKE